MKTYFKIVILTDNHYQDGEVKLYRLLKINQCLLKKTHILIPTYLTEKFFN